jgi:multidrug efflux pump subunit AcrB
MTLYGELSRSELYGLAEKARRRMMEIPGVASVGKAGDREWEIWVEVDPHTLAALKVPLETVITALRANLVDQPGGSIESSEGDIRLRGKGVNPEPEAIENIVLRINELGGQLRVGDIARVSRRFEEAQTYARFNGRPSINLTVTKTADASTIKVSTLIKQLAEELRQKLPASVYVGHHTDLSVYVKTRLNTVISSGMIGLVLVLLSLYILINFRVAAITSFGIPVSFFIAVILLYYFNFTINMVSLFAFLIVLGMIVDDAIIVTENVYRHIEQGKSPVIAAQIGTREVLWPVVVSTLTTIAAFLPMFSIGSTLGEFIKVIPVVVSCALLGSLLEAFLVLPSHAGHYLRFEKKKQNIIPWGKVLQRYSIVLRWSALNRYTVAVASVCVLAITLTFAVTRMHFEMFGHVEIGQFFVNIETPNTYSLDDSLVLATDIEKTLKSIIREDELDTMLTNVGISFIDFNRFKKGSNIMQFVIDLKKPVPHGIIEKWITPFVSMDFDDFGPRKRNADDIINEVRSHLANIPGIQRMYILKPDAGPAGSDIEIGIKSTDIKFLQGKADEISNYLRRIPGVNDVQHDQEPGKLEYQYALNAHGKRIGLTQSQLANAVRSGFLGNEVVHVTWNENRIPVRLIYPESMREQSASLAELPIVLPSGETIYLGDVAEITVGHGLNQIKRRDRQRMATITADVDSRIITANEVTNQIAREFLPIDGKANYRLLFLGEKKDADESFKGMKQALFIALAIIFFMLTVLFKSLLDPVVVMIAIPFGLIGVIIGHILFGFHLQFLSAVGVLALSGIIVNDSLLLVDFIKHMRADGMDRITAVIEAGRVRARPIILTTITTFLGISPLIFFATGQTAFLSPMAVSLGFGLVFATVLILLTLPCIYLIADDMRSMIFGKSQVDIVNQYE